MQFYIRLRFFSQTSRETNCIMRPKRAWIRALLPLCSALLPLSELCSPPLRFAPSQRIAPLRSAMLPSAPLIYSRVSRAGGQSKIFARPSRQLIRLFTMRHSVTGGHPPFPPPWPLLSAIIRQYIPTVRRASPPYCRGRRRVDVPRPLDRD